MRVNDGCHRSCEILARLGKIAVARFLYPAQPMSLSKDSNRAIPNWGGRLPLVDRGEKQPKQLANSQPAFTVSLGLAGLSKSAWIEFGAICPDLPAKLPLLRSKFTTFSKSQLPRFTETGIFTR